MPPGKVTTKAWKPISREPGERYTPPVNVTRPNGSYVPSVEAPVTFYNPPAPVPVFGQSPMPPIAQASQGVLGASAVQGFATPQTTDYPKPNLIQQLAGYDPRHPPVQGNYPGLDQIQNTLTSFGSGLRNAFNVAVGITQPNFNPQSASVSFGNTPNLMAANPIMQQGQPSPNFGGLTSASMQNQRPIPQTYQPPEWRPPTAFNGGGVSTADQAYGYNNEYLSNFISPSGTPYQVVAGYDNKGNLVSVPAVLPSNLFDNYDPASRVILWQQKKDMGYILFGGQYIYVGPGGYQREGQMFSSSTKSGGGSGGGGYSRGGGGGGGGGGGARGLPASPVQRSSMVGVQPVVNKPGIGGSSAVNFNTSTG